MTIYTPAEERDLPRSTQISTRRHGDWLLTNGIWENCYGSYQPETGVRNIRMIDPSTGRPCFTLIEHGWRDFEAANDVILRGLDKGWSTCRITNLMCWLKERRRPKARIM
jgi:hypothetical protein